jgi:hypothetical protein
MVRAGKLLIQNKYEKNKLLLGTKITDLGSTSFLGYVDRKDLICFQG